MNYCVFDGTVAEVLGVYDDEETGNELIQFRCPNGHEWSRPTNKQQIRMVGWGMDWKHHRDIAEMFPPTEEDVTEQQITPVTLY